MSRDPIPDLIFERAAELWCRLLRKPSFDNGDRESFNAILAQGMAHMNADSAAAKVDDMEATIERFRAALVERLKFLRENEGKPTGEIVYKGHPGEHERRYYLPHHLGCDYGPDELLREVAESVGLPDNLFSWKTTVAIEERCVRISAGYGAGYIYHYPMPDGRWLVCRLYGEDMPKIIQAVIEGRLDLPVEPKMEPR